MLRPLTARQQSIFEFVQRFIAERGFPPTRAEIANKFGFKSTNAADEHLHALERKGRIKVAPGTSRGIQVLEAA
jgi:repressor LexA